MASPHLEIPTLATAVTDPLTLMDDNINLLDQALQGDTSIVTTAGGTITVPSSVSLRNFYLKLTGTPGAGFNIDFPSNNRYFSVDNQSGQIATVRIAGGGGATFAVPVGEIYLLYIDGTDVINIIGGTGGTPGAAFKGCRVYAGALISIVSAGTIIQFNSESYDADALHDTVTNNTRITVDETGKWEFAAQVRWVSGSYVFGSVAIRLDGTTVIGENRVARNSTVNSTTMALQAFTAPIQLTAGQYVECRASGSPTANSTPGEYETWMTARKVG